MNKPNIKDVAEQAGVSIATVSNVMNGKGRVSEKMTRHIQAIIEEMGYSPNITARGLKQQQSYLIGMIVPFETINGNLQDNPFYWNLASGIESGARDEKFHVLFSGVQQSDPHSLDFVKHRHLDGLVIVGAKQDSQLMKQVQDLGIRAVFIDSDGANEKTFEVTIDDYEGAASATRHLIGRGHRNIICVTGELHDSSVMQQRLNGYRDTLKAHDPSGVHPPIESPVSIEGGIAAGKRIATMTETVTAVQCLSDIQAFGVMKALRDHGIQVPGDLSVTGFDDLYFSEFLSPPLTTVRQDTVLKGKTAAELLIRQILEEPCDHQKIILPTTLIERQSVYAVQINKED